MRTLLFLPYDCHSFHHNAKAICTMYHIRTNPSTRNTARGVQRSSTIPVEYGLPSSAARSAFRDGAASSAGIIRACATMPTDGDPAHMEIHRTGSGGYNFLRRRSAEEQEQISRARAQDLSARYELSDSKPDQLHKKAHIQHPIRCAPSLGGAMMSVQQAAAAYESHSAEKIEEEEDTVDPLVFRDPLLTDHERIEQLRKESPTALENRMHALEEQLAESRSNSSNSNQSNNPLLDKKSFKTKKPPSLRIDADLPPDAEGMEVMDTPEGNCRWRRPSP